MGGALEDRLKDFANRIATMAQAMVALGEEAHALVTECKMGAQMPDRWTVLQDGHVAYLAEEEVEELCETSAADLILHGPKMKLRYRRRDRKGAEVLRDWVSITLPQYKILFAGLCEPGPGHPFGNKTITRMSHHEVSARSLSSYMVGVTKLIQGGDTKGPYVYRVPWAQAVSDSTWGYRFDAKWHYVVIPQR